MRFWLSKPLYEAVPYLYLIAGLVALIASLYLDYWIWPTIGLVVGFACIIGGLVILLRRRDFRHNLKSPDAEDFDA
jgi:Flp pilus assembly protein TadB